MTKDEEKKYKWGVFLDYCRDEGIDLTYGDDKADLWKFWKAAINSINLTKLEREEEQ